MDSDFERYVGLYSADLTRLCISLCCNNHDAEDLFQETWFKAMKNYKSYNSDLPFDKWLFSICVNTFKNKRKLFYHRNKVDFKSDEEKQAFLIPYQTRAMRSSTAILNFTVLWQSFRKN